jgi:hypothetical protein
MAKKTFASFLALIAAVGIVAAVWLNRYNISDYLILRSYNPPSSIVQLAQDDTLNDNGKRLFYVNKPQISDRSAFSSQCKETEQTIVLGCYTGTNIYIFKVDDPKLNGVEQVTAAHEMLHAAYGRLDTADRKRIDSLVEAAYKRINDPRITALADSYQKQEPGSVPNELHSILATEVKDIGPELEAYYSRYFNDRSKVVEYANNYQKVFEDINQQVEAYDADLALRKAEIDRREADLTTRGQQLQAQKSDLDSLSASGQTRQYNSQVASYNSAVNSYNADIAELKVLVDEYNNLVQARNNLNLQQQNLAKSIDSRLSTINNQ